MVEVVAVWSLTTFVIVKLLKPKPETPELISELATAEIPETEPEPIALLAEPESEKLLLIV